MIYSVEGKGKLVAVLCSQEQENNPAEFGPRYPTGLDEELLAEVEVS
jgi:hypothetical protein